MTALAPIPPLAEDFDQVVSLHSWSIDFGRYTVANEQRDGFRAELQAFARANCPTAALWLHALAGELVLPSHRVDGDDGVPVPAGCLDVLLHLSFVVVLGVFCDPIYGDGAPCASATLSAIAAGLDRAARFGATEDDPEGARYIVLSDTLARQIASDLRRHEAKSETHQMAAAKGGAA